MLFSSFTSLYFVPKKENSLNTNPKTKIISLGQLLDKPFPQREFLLSPVLRDSESIMIWAAPGVGKTMFALSCAIAIAGGGSIMGWSADRPFKALYIDGEMPEHDLRDRLEMLLDTVEGLDVGAAKQNLDLMAKQAQKPGAFFPELSDEKNWPEVADMIRRKGYDVVILDNLSTLAFLDDENSSAAVNPVIKFLSEMKQSKVACIVIHHSNKAGSDYRGSSNLATTFEVILGLTPVKDILDTSDGAAFKMTFQKKRNMYGKHDLDGRIAKLVANDNTGKSEWLVETSKDEVLEAIIAVIKSGQVSTQKEIPDYLPERFWPKKQKPSAKWISNKIAAIKAGGLMKADDISEAFTAAKDEGDEEEDF